MLLTGYYQLDSIQLISSDKSAVHSNPEHPENGITQFEKKIQTLFTARIDFYRLNE